MNREVKTAIKDLVQLHQVLVNHFNEDELRDLCFELGVDYESLPGEGKAGKARELVTHLERRDRIPELLEIGRRLRPKVAWAQAYLDDRMLDLRTRRDQADQARREMRERQRVVNLRPLDVIHTFKDRVREMQELCEHLAQGSVRLVSVVGRGGMGKTALVSRVLADLERGILPVPGEDRELAVDGILYLSARSTGLSLERIYRDVGRMLGEPAASRLAARWTSKDMPLVAKVEYLLETMQGGLYLILLDNLEDELTEDGIIAEEGLCLFVERCLTQPGGARLIATSREQVKIIAAALGGVRSIPLYEGLPEDEAVALLRDLDPQNELGLRDAPEDDLRRAVQLTGSIPRALEILAGILHQDPTARLGDLLTDERLFGEQVVEKLIAAGYQRLRENEQRVMEALAVFDCPVEEAAIAYLLYPWYPGLDVRGCLRRLASGYFVSVNRATGECSLHPLDREYAYRHLPDDEEAEAYNRRNLELRAVGFYVSIRKSENEWKTIEDLAPQLAEFEHRVRGGDCVGAYQVLETIDRSYLYQWGHYARLVEMRENLWKQPISCQLQAANSSRLGSAYLRLWQIELAIKFYQEALTIAREIADRAGEGKYLGQLGFAYYLLGEIEQAIGYYKEALSIAREIKHHRREGGRLGNLGSAHLSLGQLELAIKYFEDAWDIAREVDNRREEGVQLCNLGDAYRNLGQVEQAIQLYQQALAIAQEINYPEGEERYLSSLGGAYWAIEQIEDAIDCHKKALAIACKVNDHRGRSYQLLGLGRPLLVTGSLLEARRCCVESLALDVSETSYQAALVLGIVLLTSRSLYGRAASALAEAAPTPPNFTAELEGEPGESFLFTLHQSNSARDAFADAIARCQAMLDKTTGLHKPRYILAAALVGQAVCDLSWAQENKQVKLLAPALAEYRRALEITSAPGIVRDALRDLELIRAAGIEGLEPVFELLEGAPAQAKHDDET